jgi:tripartite-type tricarboxylate transporter receptor subunit TctC
MRRRKFMTLIAQTVVRPEPRNCWLGMAIFLFFAGGLTINAAYAQIAVDFYRGKQITLMVGSSPGGGYDAVGRVVAHHIGKFIPGNPTVVVQNIPGGAGVTMSNRIFRTEPQDGTVIGLVQRGVLLAQLTGQSNVHFDIAKFNWIGSVSPDTSLVVAWNTAPVRSMQDLLVNQLIVGGTGATGDLEAAARLLNATIGTKFKIVSGYAGQANVLLAMERGEVEGAADWSWSNIKARHSDYLKEKKINLILQNALSPAPDLPNVPLAIDFIKDDTDRRAAELYFGLKHIARPILAGPGVPADRVEALRDALMALKDDAEFKADAVRIGLDDPTAADEIEKFVKLSAAASPAVIGRLTAIINPNK